VNRNKPASIDANICCKRIASQNYLVQIQQKAISQNSPIFGFVVPRVQIVMRAHSAGDIVSRMDFALTPF